MSMKNTASKGNRCHLLEQLPKSVPKIWYSVEQRAADTRQPDPGFHRFWTLYDSLDLPSKLNEYWSCQIWSYRATYHWTFPCVGVQLVELRGPRWVQCSRSTSSHPLRLGSRKGTALSDHAVCTISIRSLFYLFIVSDRLECIFNAWRLWTSLPSIRAYCPAAFITRLLSICIEVPETEL